jgi:hypothetical protein
MNNSIEIPFFIEKRRIIVFANIDGIDGKFQWDTGAEISLINNVNNFKYFNFDNTYYNISNYSRKQKKYELNKLCFGNNIIKSKSLIAKTPGIINKICLKPTKTDGILGLHIFSGYWCELSFSKQKIILYKNKPEKYFKKTKLIKTNRGLYINSKINNKKYALEIDTGCPYSILINDCNFPKQNPIKIFTSSSNYNGFYYKILTNFQLFNCKFNNCYITYTQNIKNYGIIGLEYLKNYDFLFDLTNTSNNGDYLYFKKASDFKYLKNYIFPKKIINNLILDYWTYQNGIKLELHKKNILFKYGIDHNSLIIEINRIPIKNYDLNMLKTQILSKDIYELTVREGNIKRIIKLEA